LESGGINMDISKKIIRIDAEDKLLGKSKYIGDIEFENMLFAKTVRSDRVRAKIRSIKYPKLPEGYFIVDKNDVPGLNKVKVVENDQPFFADGVVNYIGEPIALVIGESKERILDLISQIEIEYEDLEAVYTIEDGLKTSKPLFGEDNCFADYHYSKNSLEEIKSKAKYIISGEYRTGYQEQMYLEPQGVVGIYNDGKVEVHGSMQCPYYVKGAVEQCMGFEPENVRIVQSTTGGAFGGKEDYPSLIAGHVAVAAYKAKQPVQLIFDREEDVEVTPKRHPSLIHLTSYIDKNHKVIGMEADIKLDGGAYLTLSTIVLQRAIFAAIGAYNVEHVFVRGRAVATNTVPSGAFRGFGAPQSLFALETHMEKCAKELGIDALDFKLNNLMKQNDRSSTNGIMRDPIILPEIVERIDELSKFRKKKAEFAKHNKTNPEKLKGIGMSIFFHGGGFTGSGEQDHIKAKVKLHKSSDGKVNLLLSNVEMGQGVHTTMRKIAAKALELPIESIAYNNPDTDYTMDSGPTVASRTIMVVGKLVQEACEELKSNWINNEEQIVITNYKQPEGFSWDGKNFIGDVYNSYSWGVNVVEVSVDPITFQTDVDHIWAIYDIGKAIDEMVVRGQIEGGIIQGLGYGGLEVMEVKKGKIQQKSITDYIIPTSKDVPKITSELMNVPYIHGPYGAKGLGELTLIGTAPAYSLAVSNALDMEINKIPVKPEELIKLVK
jgi:CO/xanthine dehydrogenase Mo-binding subunit